MISTFALTLTPSSKPARIRKAILQPLKAEWGLALPNFRRYYWAANLQKILYLMNDDCASLPVWVHLEKAGSRLPLHSALCSQLPLPLTSVGACPIVSLSLKIWSQVRKNFGLQGPSVLTPLLKNHIFTPSSSGIAFRAWHNKGVQGPKYTSLSRTPVIGVTSLLPTILPCSGLALN